MLLKGTAAAEEVEVREARLGAGSQLSGGGSGGPPTPLLLPAGPTHCTTVCRLDVKSYLWP